jgi:ABC-type polysaccharide/polyol phosphate transport system ATPase subunit
MSPLTDEVLKLEGVWRRYRRWKRRPVSLKEALVRLMNRDGLAYEDFWALQDISLAVCRGEIIGICGANGSGKSTLLKVIARIVPATHGHIIVRERIATLLELGSGFLPELSGRENITLNGAIMGISDADMAGKTASIIEFADIGKFIDSPVKIYSSGMYMRLGFAIASHIEADILLLDEMLGVGDVEFKKKCLTWLHQLRQKGVTVLLVSHDLPTLFDTCDRVIWLDKGCVMAEGNPGEVLTQYCPEAVLPIHKNLYGIRDGRSYALTGDSRRQTGLEDR